MSDLVESAARYLNAGLPVIALQGKAPHTGFHPRGLHDAITGTVETEGDIAQLATVFDDPTVTGIGLPMPQLEAGSLVVVDIDGEEGAERYAELVGADYLDIETAAARTGRGLHLWFLTPRVGQGSRTLGPKLDLKGVGGYVAAPPSLHPDGHRYEWLASLVVDGVLKVDWLPAGIEKFLAAVDELREEYSRPQHVYTLYNLSLQDGAWRLHTEPTAPPIDGLVAAVRDAREGNRNNMLAWAAMTARDEGVSLEEAMRALGAAAVEAGLGEREVRTTIRTKYRSRRDA